MNDMYDKRAPRQDTGYDADLGSLVTPGATAVALAAAVTETVMDAGRAVIFSSEADVVDHEHQPQAAVSGRSGNLTRGSSDPEAVTDMDQPVSAGTYLRSASMTAMGTTPEDVRAESQPAAERMVRFGNLSFGSSVAA